MIRVKAAIGNEKYKMVLNSATNVLIADEPKDSGGEDQGFSPSELLASSLAACTSVTIKMYADRKGYPLERAEVEVTFEKEGNKSVFKRYIKLFGSLTAEEEGRLMQFANQCFIHKTLTGAIEVETHPGK